jgi:hypothetical protein
VKPQQYWAHTVLRLQNDPHGQHAYGVEGGTVRRWVNVTALAATLLVFTPLARARVVPSLTTTLTMDCSMFSTVCTFDPGRRGSPEQGMADFAPVAPGWAAAFQSDPAIAWGFIHRTYFAEFGVGGSFTIEAPGGMQLSGMLTSGVAFRFPTGYAATVAWFQGYWNNGLYADGLMVGESLRGQGSSATLEVTTYTPEPSSLLLFGSALTGLAGVFRRSLSLRHVVRPALFVLRVLRVGVAGFTALAAERTSPFVNTAKRNGCVSRK